MVDCDRGFQANEPPQNEKRKDKDLTERIERLLKQRDEAIKGVDLRESINVLSSSSVSRTLLQTRLRSQ